MDIKNRIVKYDMVLVSEIVANPNNWRKHPIYQEKALRGALYEVGIVQNILINVRTGNLIDGHLRVLIAQKDGVEYLPATFVDLTPEEENLILSVLDPIGAMAETNQDALNSLIEHTHAVNEDLQGVLDKLKKRTEEKTEEVLVKRSVQLKPPQEYVIIVCDTKDEFEELRHFMGLGMVRRGGYKPGSEFDDTGPERLISYKTFMEWANVSRNTK